MNFEGARDTRADIRADLPPQVIAAIDEICGDLIADLGESPEAWYGAQSAINALMNKPIITAITEGRLGEKPPDNSVMTLIMLVLGQFLSHPVTMANIELARRLRKEAQGG